MPMATKVSSAPVTIARLTPAPPIVVKIGGRLEPEATRRLARDIAARVRRGERIVLVHGGGPAIDARLQELGIAPRFANGLRVTGPQELAVAEEVLSKTVGAALAEMLRAAGAKARAMKGRDLNLLVAEPVAPETGLGLVGSVVGVNVGLLERTLAEGVVPVVSPIASDGAGGSLNVNADEAASAVAAALHASHLIQVTDVPFVLDEAGRPVARLSAGEARLLLAGGAARDGMVPKLKAALEAVGSGVPVAVIGNADAAEPVSHLIATGGTKVHRAHAGAG